MNERTRRILRAYKLAPRFANNFASYERQPRNIFEGFYVLGQHAVFIVVLTVKRDGIICVLHQRLEAFGLVLVYLFRREPLCLLEFIEGSFKWFAVAFAVYAKGMGVQQ